MVLKRFMLKTHPTWYADTMGMLDVPVGSINKSQSDVLNGSIRKPIQQVRPCEMGFQWVDTDATLCFTCRRQSD
jgi:hypothetical protein